MHHIFQCIVHFTVVVTDNEAFDLLSGLRSQASCDGTGCLYLVGCGYNAYPAGSPYNEYPQMDNKQEDRERRKYRYIIHAEQNALTFRSEHGPFIGGSTPSRSYHHLTGVDFFFF